jgi:hypothetical protein
VIVTDKCPRCGDRKAERAKVWLASFIGISLCLFLEPTRLGRWVNHLGDAGMVIFGMTVGPLMAAAIWMTAEKIVDAPFKEHEDKGRQDW